MNEMIVRPDPVAAVLIALNANLATLGQSGVVAYAQVPTTRPAKFVKVTRIGGPVTGLVVDNAMVNLEAWATTDKQSLDLAAAASAIVNAMAGSVVGTTTVYRVTEFSGPANSPDPASSTPRHTWTVEVACRAGTPSLSSS